MALYSLNPLYSLLFALCLACHSVFVILQTHCLIDYSKFVKYACKICETKDTNCLCPQVSEHLIE